jgi:hypothetical protein
VILPDDGWDRRGSTQVRPGGFGSETLRVVTGADQETGGSIGTHSIEVQKARSGRFQQFDQDQVGIFDFRIEVLDALGQVSDHQVGDIADRIGTRARPHAGCLVDESPLVSILEPDPDRFGSSEHQMA